MEPIKLQDGTELIALEPAEKEALEAELKVVLDKYNAMYLPVLREEESLTHKMQKAALLILKKNDSIKSPFTDGEPGTTEEAPKAD